MKIDASEAAEGNWNLELLEAVQVVIKLTGLALRSVLTVRMMALVLLSVVLAVATLMLTGLH